MHLASQCMWFGHPKAASMTKVCSGSKPQQLVGAGGLLLAYTLCTTNWRVNAQLTQNGRMVLPAL